MLKGQIRLILVVVNIVASLSCIALFFKFMAIPIYAKHAYAEEYKNLVFQCDNVMRDHLIAKNRVNFEKSEDAIKNLHSAEIGLLTCNDYDKLRKRMIVFGVTEAELSLLGLEAIEDKSGDVRGYVRTHEFKY